MRHAYKVETFQAFVAFDTVSRPLVMLPTTGAAECCLSAFAFSEVRLTPGTPGSMHQREFALLVPTMEHHIIHTHTHTHAQGSPHHRGPHAGWAAHSTTPHHCRKTHACAARIAVGLLSLPGTPMGQEGIAACMTAEAAGRLHSRVEVEKPLTCMHAGMQRV